MSTAVAPRSAKQHQRRGNVILESLGALSLPVVAAAFLLRWHLKKRKASAAAEQAQQQAAAKKAPGGSAQSTPSRSKPRREYKVRRDRLQAEGADAASPLAQQNQTAAASRPGHDGGHDEQGVDILKQSIGSEQQTSFLQMLQQMGFKVQAAQDGSGQMFLQPPAQGEGGDEYGDEDEWEDEDELDDGGLIGEGPKAGKPARGGHYLPRGPGSGPMTMPMGMAAGYGGGFGGPDPEDMDMDAIGADLGRELGGDFFDEEGFDDEDGMFGDEDGMFGDDDGMFDDDEGMMDEMMMGMMMMPAPGGITPDIDDLDGGDLLDNEGFDEDEDPEGGEGEGEGNEEAPL